jgi:hypothetical protein
MRTTPKKAKTLDGDVTEQEIKTRDLWPIADLAARLDVSAEAIRKRVIRHSMKVMRQGPDGSMIFDQGTATCAILQRATLKNSVVRLSRTRRY